MSISIVKMLELVVMYSLCFGQHRAELILNREQ